MTMKSRIVVAGAIEYFYVVVRNYLSGIGLSPIAGEVLLTLLRLIVAVVYWLMFRNFVRRVKPNVAPITQGLFVLGWLVVLTEIVLKANPHPGILVTERAVFIVTSFVVGWREELFYRGVLQNFFDRKWGPAVGILVSNTLFVLYHVGTAPFVFSSITQWFLLGLVSALIYMATRSLSVVALEHGIYDALFFGGPYIRSPIGFGSAAFLELLALGFLGVWAWRNADLKW